ncbi:MAG: hypothetical protein WD830_11965 [Chloroflexota bacterium]
MASTPAADDGTGERSATRLIAEGVLDGELAGLLWSLLEGGVPLVVATRHGEAAATEVRSAFAALVGSGHATADGALPGGTVHADSLEDLMRFSGAEHLDDVPDEARDLGVVLVLGRATPGEPLRLVRAHYVRPIERDAAGHIQRRPPALLSAWDEQAARLDHFFWAITDELATRVGSDAHDFDVAHRRRVRLLNDLAAARVFEADEIRRHIERAALVEAGTRGAAQADAPN